MKRFGNATLNPDHVRAVSPVRVVSSLTASGLERGKLAPTYYKVLFLDGSRIDLDAESAIALMAELAGPAPAPASQPISRPGQPDPQPQ